MNQNRQQKKKRRLLTAILGFVPMRSMISEVALIVVCGIGAPILAQDEFKDFDALMQDAASRSGVSSVSPNRPSEPSDPGIPGSRLPARETPKSESSDSSLRFTIPRGSDSSATPQFPEFNRTNSNHDSPDIDSRFRGFDSARPPEVKNGGGVISPVLQDRNGRSRLRFVDPTALATEGPEFDWKQQVTSVADLRFPLMNTFQHGDAFMTPQEEDAYLQMFAAIDEQRRQLIRRTSGESVPTSLETQRLTAAVTPNISVRGTAVWQEAFYQFANARGLAWNNGHLRGGRSEETIGGLPDPFSPAQKTDISVSDKDRPYVLLDDIRRHPEDYVGRPVVLYGRYTAGSIVRLGVKDPAERIYDERSAGATRSGVIQPEVRLMRGTLTALDGVESLAMVDTRELLTPQMGTLQPSEWPGDAGSIVVMIKGWVVKKWDSRPLIFCESMRQISPIPHFQLIRENSIDRSRIREEEKWLYYETLTQLGLTRNSVQQDVAQSVLFQRIDELMLQVKTKSQSDLQQLQAQLKASTITEDEHKRKKVSVQRRLNQRAARYRNYKKHPERFQTYVDVFQNPEFWHGHLVTLRGHVRHVVSYPADNTLMNKALTGQGMLHELWLFTDDSQHNPAVIVTPNLPADFPFNAEVIDRVSVTGCFFKRYIYGSQKSDRIAPLLLAGSVQWQPTVDQVQALVKDGHLEARSPRAARADVLGAGPGNTAMMLLCLIVVLIFMILWGRAQREERDRVRLRKRVNDLPDIDGTAALALALGRTEFDDATSVLNRRFGLTDGDRNRP